jgi:hypothetical protein
VVYCFGLYNDEHVALAPPEVAERRPEQSVQSVQYWAWPLAFEHGNLLSKRQDFKGSVLRLWQKTRIIASREEGFGREFSLVTRRNVDLPMQSRGISSS